MFKEQKLSLLRALPSVDKVMLEVSSQDFFIGKSKTIVANCVKFSINAFRSMILKKINPFEGDRSVMECVIKDARRRISEMLSLGFRRVVNATGVILHTNLGRSLVSRDVIENLNLISSFYSNLEFDLVQGFRGSRCSVIEPILCELCGAEAAFVVNNNAGAVLICLDTLAGGKEVIISRGELVEIGGSFRIPDIMLKSGAMIKEVGTTNRTHLKDYRDAITDRTAMFLKVHTSNYNIVGFTSSVSLSELVSLGKRKSVVVMEDLGSGTLIDFSKYGLTKEPTVQESLNAGVDIVTFSGDKLFGGPQAGIILGKKKYIDCIKNNSLARVLRIDKMTLAVLESTLHLYYDEKLAIKKIPTLRMLLQDMLVLEQRAFDLRNRIMALSKKFDKCVNIDVLDLVSCAGGGALPTVDFPSKCLGIQIEGLSVNTLEEILRRNYIPIIGRIENDYYILDFRTILDNEAEIIEATFENLFANLSIQI